MNDAIMKLLAKAERCDFYLRFSSEEQEEGDAHALHRIMLRQITGATWPIGYPLSVSEGSSPNSRL
jgi:hypothetical protein